MNTQRRGMPPWESVVERARLQAIADELKECYHQERKLSERINLLRDEQARLNARVYNA